MKAIGIGLVAVAFGASVAFSTGVTLTEQVRNTLTMIDTVPSRLQIDVAFGSGVDALTNLSAIAQDPDGDVGVRVRAIHGLGKYCAAPCAAGDVAHQSLVALIDATRNESLGEPVVLLRAAIETIGTMRVATDVSLLVTLLDHPSRDIRAATARALRDLCNTQAVTPLRVRYANETTDQVKIAISEALRILGQCTP